MKSIRLSCAALLAAAVLAAAPPIEAQHAAMSLSPGIVTLHPGAGDIDPHPPVSTLVVDYTDSRSSCAKVTRVVALAMPSPITPVVLASHDLPSPGLCNWGGNTVSLPITPFKGQKLTGCGTISIPVIVALLAPKTPTMEQSLINQYNSAVNTVLGTGSPQGSNVQYYTVVSNTMNVQGQVNCGGSGGTSSGYYHSSSPGTSSNTSSSPSSGSNYHSASPAGGSSGSNYHSASPPSGSSGTSQGSGHVHTALPPASLSLSVPQYAGACPVTLNALGSYSPSSAGTANVVWKFGDGATSARQMPVTAGANNIALPERVTASRNTTLTLTVTTSGITSTQTVPFGVHCN